MSDRIENPEYEQGTPVSFIYNHEADFECPHTYFDGRSAVTQVKWSEKGFVGRCNLCGDVIEQ